MLRSCPLATIRPHCFVTMTGSEYRALLHREIVLQYERLTPRSALAHRDAAEYLPGGDTRAAVHFPPYPLCVAYGRGASLVDVDGREYLDMLGNYSSMLHGHAHPELTRAISDGAALGTGVGAVTEYQTKCARLIGQG